MISANQHDELLATGYLVVDDVVPVEQCQAVIEAVAEFLKIDPEDPATWYTSFIEGHGIVPLHHGQALWDVRQLPSVYELFCDLYQDGALWVTMDRVSFKAPAKDRDVRVSGLHWDSDPRLPREASFQGLVYLRDTDKDQGAFCCVPEVYANLTDWLDGRDVAEARDALNSDDQKIEHVGGKAGSMVIWHRQMPHSSARNDGDRARWVQYVTMDRIAGEDERLERVRLFEEKHPPQWAIRQKVRGQLIPEPGPTANLTALGRKLVGIDTWT